MDAVTLTASEQPSGRKDTGAFGEPEGEATVAVSLLLEKRKEPGGKPLTGRSELHQVLRSGYSLRPGLGKVERRGSQMEEAVHRVPTIDGGGLHGHGDAEQVTAFIALEGNGKDAVTVLVTRIEENAVICLKS